MYGEEKKQQWHKHFTMLYEIYKHSNTYASDSKPTYDVYFIAITFNSQHTHKDKQAHTHSHSYIQIHRAVACRHFETLGILLVFISICTTDAERKPNKQHEQKKKIKT